MQYRELVALATEARKRAHAPYSHFPVGAAVLAESGKIYVGCNVENVSYGLTMCAERVAVFRAVCSGERGFRAIAVVTETQSSPCGACRQVLSEFVQDMDVVVADAEGRTELHRLADLFPHPFSEWRPREDERD